MELSQDISPQECAACGVVFGITEHYERCRRNDSRSFTCPNGHAMNFNAGKTVPEMLTETQKLTEENITVKRNSISLQAKIDQLESKIAQLTAK